LTGRGDATGTRTGGGAVSGRAAGRGCAFVDDGRDSDFAGAVDVDGVVVVDFSSTGGDGSSDAAIPAWPDVCATATS